MLNTAAVFGGSVQGMDTPTTSYEGDMNDSSALSNHKRGAQDNSKLSERRLARNL